MTAYSTQLFAAAAAIAMASGLAAPARAQADEQLSVRVPYGDIDLTSHAGRRAVEQRVRTAAATVCGPSFDRDLAVAWRARACRVKALAAAKQQLEVAIARLDKGERYARAAPAAADGLN